MLLNAEFSFGNTFIYGFFKMISFYMCFIKSPTTFFFWSCRGCCGAFYISFFIHDFELMLKLTNKYFAGYKTEKNNIIFYFKQKKGLHIFSYKASTSTKAVPD